MANPKSAPYGDAPVEAAPSPPYAASPACFLSGQAYIAEADMMASEMDGKWGAGRLRLLVSPELREKFDRQRYLLNQAIWHGELADVQREAKRMCSAWRAADRAATEAGHATLAIDVWEVALEDGTVAAIVRPNGRHARIEPCGRDVTVYTLEEIGRLLSGFPALAKAKEHFPGAVVIAVRPSQSDPLDLLVDSK